MLSRRSDAGIRGRRDASSGREALSLIDVLDPDLVLLDLWLRVEDKRDFSPEWLADFWRRHGFRRS